MVFHTFTLPFLFFERNERVKKRRITREESQTREKLAVNNSMFFTEQKSPQVPTEEEGNIY